MEILERLFCLLIGCVPYLNTNNVYLGDSIMLCFFSNQWSSL